MKENEIKSRVLKGVFYNFTGALAKNGVSFFISIFLSRILSPSDFGLIGMAMVFITFAQGFSDLGLSSGIIHIKEVSQRELSSVFFFNLFVSVALAILLFAAAGWISDFYRNAEVLQVIKAVSFLFVINSLNTVHNALLYKKIEIKITRVSTLVSVFVSGLVGILIAYFGGGVWSLVVSTYLASIIPVLIIWSYSKWRPSFLFHWQDVKNLMPMGIKVFFTTYLDTVFSRIDVLVIGRLFSPSVLGYYFRAQSLNHMVTKYSSQGLSGVFFPAVSRMEGDLVKISDFYAKAMNAVCLISFFLTGALFITAEPLIIILFGEIWLPSVVYFKILAFNSFVFGLTIIFNGVLLGTGNAGKMFILELFRKILNTAGLFIGLFFGLEEYLWLLVFTSILGLFVSFVFVKQLLHIKVVSNAIMVFKYGFPLFFGIFFVFTFKYFYSASNVWLNIITNSFCYAIGFVFFTYIFKQEGFLIIKRVLHKYAFMKARLK